MIVLVLTAGAFWFLGGQHYLQNKSEIDYTLFHHPEHETSPLSWLGLFVQSGACAAVVALIISTVTLLLWNRQTKPHR